MKHDLSWPERLNAVFGVQVQRHRKRRDMRQDQLAEACGRLGLPISRSKIANLENGRARQEGVSVAEAMVIARALDIPPALLVFPLTADPAEPLPDVQVPAFDAIEWFGGGSANPMASGMHEKPNPVLGDDEEAARRWRVASVPLALHREQARLVETWRITPVGAAGDSEEEVKATMRRYQDIRRSTVEQLRLVREIAQGVDIALPDLPDDLAQILESAR